ncbi:eCIS core domain-containing protein, partial [Streptomyces sp. NPDC002454]
MSGVTRVRQQQPEPPRRTRAKRSVPLRDAWARRTPPAPQEVLARAGKPLEPGVGRLMEEWLGHDFSAVRIHSDRDAAVLAETVGADAVAVGRDIFFAAGAYRPETAQGLRLLAHELLHTVQVPDAPGRLRLGRQDGVLSRPLDGVEREAEERVNRAADDRAAGAGVGEREARGRGAQPVSWLRFISVDVSQMRAEQLDPATLVDRIVAGVVRTLHGDPADAAGRVRQQLVRLAPELRSAVLTRLRQRLPSPECLRVERLVAEAETPAGTPVGAATVPEPVVEPAERERTERRDLTEREAGDERGRADRERDGDEEQRQHAQDRDRGRTEEGAGQEEERKQQDVEREKEAALDHRRGEAAAAREDERGGEDEEHRRAAAEDERAETEDGEQPAAEGASARTEAPTSGAAVPPAAPAAAGADGAGAGPGGGGGPGDKPRKKEG